MRYTATVALTVSLIIALAAVCSGQGLIYGSWDEATPETEPTPSWYGYTGLVRTPTALISTPQKITGSAHQVKLDGETRKVYAVTVGLMPTLEIGAARIENVLQDTLIPTYATETVVNVKYEANIGGLFNNPMAPKMAIGIFDISDQVNRTNYVVLSRSIGLAQGSASPLPQANVHIGYAKAEREPAALDGIFAGVDFVAAQDTLAQIEYDGEDINGALRYYPAPWLSLDAGMVNSEFGYGFTINSGF